MRLLTCPDCGLKFWALGIEGLPWFLPPGFEHDCLAFQDDQSHANASSFGCLSAIEPDMIVEIWDGVGGVG